MSDESPKEQNERRLDYTLPLKGLEAKPIETRDAIEARSADGSTMSAIERRRTNRSTGSLAKDQEMSIEIEFGDGSRASRLNQISEKQAATSENPPEDLRRHIPLPHPVKPPERFYPAPSPILHPQQVHETDCPPAPGPFPQASLPRPLDSVRALDKPFSPRPLDSVQALDQPPHPKPLDSIPMPGQPFSPGRGPVDNVVEKKEVSEKTGDPLDLLRKQLADLANEKIANPREREQFRQDMATFEESYPERSVKEDHENIEEVKKTYEQLCRLMSANGDVLDRYADKCKQVPGATPWRIQAAEQIMFHAADPTTVDQGRLAVCPTAALQVREYYRDPASVARLVTDVVLTGTYKTRAHDETIDKTIDLTTCPPNLIPDTEARKYNIDHKIHGINISSTHHIDDPERSWASQIFDNTATNLVLSGRCYRFEESPSDGATASQYQNGSVINLSNGNRLPWDIAMKANILVLDGDMVKLNQWIIGKREIGFLIVAAHLTEEEAKDPAIKKAYEFIQRENGEIYLYSTRELPKILDRVHKAQAWPPIVNLDTALPPINKAEGGSHFLLIHETNGDGSSLGYDNTWGKEQDRMGASRVSTLEIASSIRAIAAREPSSINGAKYLADFCKNNHARWNQSLMTWLELPAKIQSQMPLQSAADYLKAHPADEPVLVDWIKRHPQDRDLGLWMQTLNEWLDKYPAERPTR